SLSRATPTVSVTLSADGNSRRISCALKLRPNIRLLASFITAESDAQEVDVTYLTSSPASRNASAACINSGKLLGLATIIIFTSLHVVAVYGRDKFRPGFLESPYLGASQQSEARRA